MIAGTGLVNFVDPTSTLNQETDKLANRLASGPSLAYGHAKRLMYASINNQLELQLRLETEAFADCARSKDFLEGITAIIEKLQLNFSES